MKIAPQDHHLHVYIFFLHPPNEVVLLFNIKSSYSLHCIIFIHCKNSHSSSLHSSISASTFLHTTNTFRWESEWERWRWKWNRGERHTHMKWLSSTADRERVRSEGWRSSTQWKSWYDGEVSAVYEAIIKSHFLLLQ